MGIPEPTMQAWSARGQWFAKPQQPPTVTRQTGPNSIATAATKPSQALQNVMEQRKSKSRLLLSKYVLNAAKIASRSRSPLKDAQNVRHVAAVHSSIWPEQAGSNNVQINLAIGIGGVE